MKDFTERGVKLGVFRKLDKFSQLQLLSGIDALECAGITVSEENERKIGTIIGTSAGPVTEVSNFQKNICDKGTTAGSAFTFPVIFPFSQKRRDIVLRWQTEPKPGFKVSLMPVMC